MRAVALADETVQKKIADSFVPLKIAILPGTEDFPLAWPAMRQWRRSYSWMGGKKCEGFTCCTAVSPDLQIEYGNTGSAFVWELFDSIAYDPEKFSAMLDESVKRAKHEQAILADDQLTDRTRAEQLASYRRKIQREIHRAGHFRLPPKGFTVKGAIELFEMSGDLPKKD